MVNKFDMSLADIIKSQKKTRPVRRRGNEGVKKQQLKRKSNSTTPKRRSRGSNGTVAGKVRCISF